MRLIDTFERDANVEHRCSMAGEVSRFLAAGYSDPKPLIPIHGVPMIHWVIENLRPREKHRFIFVCQQVHLQKYELAEKLKQWAPGSALISLQRLKTAHEQWESSLRSI